MKTIKFVALLLSAVLILSCEKSRGPEKSGAFPKTFLYAGLDLHPSKYYQWNGGNSFTELPGVEFPEYHDGAYNDMSITSYYEEFHPFLLFTLEDDTLIRVISREVENFPQLDTIVSYQNNGNSINLFASDPSAIPYIWHFENDDTRLESRGFSSNFNYFSNFDQGREYFAYTITEGTRLDKTELELLDLIVEDNKKWLKPNDTIQLKLFEVVHELEQ